MRYEPFGVTGMEVSRLCLGTMMFGAVGNPDHEVCARMIHTALDAGINVVDTADMYGGGESETIIGKALGSRRDDVILATKGHFGLQEGPNRSGNSRRWLTKAVDDSLRRLQTDWIDLYQLHRPDERTDVEETVGVLEDLVTAGKIRAFGTSTFAPHQLVEVHHVAARRGRAQFRSEQPPYSLLARGAEADVFPVAARLRLAVLVWSPLAFGFLTGQHRSATPAEPAAGRAAIRPAWFDQGDPAVRRKVELAEQLARLADEIGCTLPDLAVAFTLSHPAVTSTIIGPRTPEQLQSTLSGADVVLDDEALDRIDQIVPPGTDVYDARQAAASPWLTEVDRRRRPLATRGV